MHNVPSILVLEVQVQVITRSSPLASPRAEPLSLNSAAKKIKV